MTSYYFTENIAQVANSYNACGCENESSACATGGKGSEGEDLSARNILQFFI